MSKEKYLWIIRRLIRRFGYDFRVFGLQNADYQLASLFKRRKISTIFDVGANRGQFADRIRRFGFDGYIHSFEPLPDAFARLERRGIWDTRFSAHQLALSDGARIASMSVGCNDETSSLLPPSSNEQTASVAPIKSIVDVRCVRLEEILDKGVLDDVDPSRTLLKLDVQGHELAVLNGAGRYLREFPAILLEAGILPIYEGEADFATLTDYLREQGFGILGFKGGFFHPSHGFMMQIDVLFENFGHDLQAMKALGTNFEHA